MEFSKKEQATIIAALNVLLTDDMQRGEAALAGALGRPEDISALIERIEREGQR